jgi:hypothetical protein
MSTVSQYDSLIQQGLIIPRPESPLSFKFPSLLVYVPSITNNHVIDLESVRKVSGDAKLERDPK